MIILAPTDFSRLSKVAILYAAQMAIKMKAELMIIHIVFGQASVRAMMVSPKLEEEMKQIAREDMENLVAEIKKEVKGRLTITTHIILGFPVSEMILGFMKKIKVDCVVTATQGATGLKKVLIGTNAAALMEDASAPVILVPRNSSYKALRRVVYASDLLHLDQELSILRDFIKPYNAAIEVVHVLPEEAEDSIDAGDIRKDLIQKMNYQKINFTLIHNDDITGALDNFMIDSKGDMLVMFTHKPGFFEKLFSRSVTRKIAFHSSIPMLTFNRKMLDVH